MKVGVFGGSFNPPHIGHLIVAESVRDQAGFDTILFVPAAQPPHKNDPSLGAPEARLEMTLLATRDNPGFSVSDLEIRRNGMSYTIDTLRAVAGLHPGAALSLIIGADNFIEFPAWKSPRDILAVADLVVMSRPGFPAEGAKHEFSRSASFVNVPGIGVSGTDIRRRVKQGRPIRYLVPPPVEEYIVRHGLYAG